MRRFLFLLLTVTTSIFFAGSVVAKPKTRQQAQRDVETFLSQKGISLKVERSMARGQQDDSQESIYFFDVEGGNGFVIASGDDNTPAILGYTDSGSYDEETLPEDMKWWLESYKQQIEYANKEQQTASVRASTRASLTNHAKIAPLLTTKWDQAYPYNLKCPSSGYTQCVTGCAATAIAQIMYYYRNESIRELPRELKGYSYISSDINVYTFPQGSVIDWDNMLDSYSTSFIGGETSAQKNAVAYLMAYLGSAMKMKYGTEASSSNLGNVRAALINFFNYSETMTIEEREDYSDTEWDNLIYSELAAGRPVNYTGIAVDGENKSGHSFVCDGYDGDGYYHINWGWGGTADGCFLLSALNPEVQGTGGASSAYTTGHEILIGIVPKDLKYADYEAYAAKDNGTLTFYYDQQRASRGEDTYDMEKVQTTTVIFVNPRPNWNDSYKEVTDITKVKFDESFEAWHPTSAYYWFYWFTKMSSIEGLEFLDAQHIKNLTYMFGNCESLKEVTLPDNLRMIDQRMFYGCQSLNSVSIPAGVSSIGDYAFWNCTSLSTITSEIQNPFAINSSTFPSAIYSTATLKVPAGKKSLYQSTNGWNLFKNIEEMGGEVVTPTYTLKYVVDGVDYKVLTLYEGDEITPEPAPTKSGYTFSGWSNIPTTMPAYNVTITGTFTKDAPTKCATPTINYNNGEISFSCATEGVKFVSEISVADAKEYHGSQISLTKIYIIKVYASKDGYTNSDEVTREITFAGSDTPTLKGDVDGNGVVNEDDHVKLSDIIMKK